MAGDRVRAWLDRAPDDWSPPTARDLTGPFAYLFWLIRQQGRQIALGTTLGSCWMITLGMTVSFPDLSLKESPPDLARPTKTQCSCAAITSRYRRSYTPPARCPARRAGIRAAQPERW